MRLLPVLLVALLLLSPGVLFADGDGRARFGVVNAHFDPDSADVLGVSWTRVPFFWSDIQPTRAVWNPERAITDGALQRELDGRREVVGVVLSTPSWAAARAADGPGAVPANLDRDTTDPENHWAQFVGRLARTYVGRIDTWILWNEPDFRPGDRGSGGYVPWMGDERAFYRLIRTGAEAIRRENPNARVVFAASSYWVDLINGRPPFLQRWLAVAQEDPAAQPNRYWVDAVALNLYCSADHVFVIGSQFRTILYEAGVDLPLWLTETNCPPSDDPDTPAAFTRFRTTLVAQAAFLVETFGAARAAGFERIAWYQLRDGSDPFDTYALVRRDGSRRPVFDAFRLAADVLGEPGDVSYAGLDEEGNEVPMVGWSLSPPGRLVRVRRIDRDVLIAWNMKPRTIDVTLEAPRGDATAIDALGRPIATTWSEHGLRVRLLPAEPITIPGDPPDYYRYGGPPTIITVQRCVQCSPSS